jgi:hypothetical protein
MSGSVGTGGNAGIWRRAEQAPDDVAPGRGAPSKNIEETHIMVGQTPKQEHRDVVQERKEERREDKRDDRRDNNRDQDDKKDKDHKHNN